MRKIHMLCNAHIDPVWHWEWEEGAAAALSTFRAAADMCEENDDFIFCHNEALLYQWIEEYEPALFARIQKLVRQGKWHIMGGWYLQPDCNMPCGESFVRQIKLGRDYFREKFGVEPSVAVNFDSFGHSRGMVQIMRQAGYTGYLFMRPGKDQLELPAPDFTWVGCDGSEIAAHRLTTSYGLPRFGMAGDRMSQWLAEHPDAEIGLITWGVGNHGGGPSRKDIADIADIMLNCPESGLMHSTPERYFGDVAEAGLGGGRVAHSLAPFSVGCYTSQILVKQTHRRLEAALSATERICAHAHLTAGMAYPRKEIDEAATDLCMAEFHDILPGSSTQRVEQMALRRMQHGLENLNRIHARAFFVLSAGEPAARPGETPVLVYNPHPWPVEGDFSCEFSLADSVSDDVFIRPRVFDACGEVVSQVEKEESSMPVEWRKRVTFHTTLKPGAINRFDCRLETLDVRPAIECPERDGRYIFDNGTLHVEIDRATGSITRYSVDGTDCLTGRTRMLVIADNEDSWGMRVEQFREEIGEFHPMSAERCAEFCALKAERLEPVRVVESGDVRVIIEACMEWNDSAMILRYILPRHGSHVEVEARVFWMEKHRMLKFAVPTGLTGEYVGEAPFGTDELFADGRETVAQRWTAALAGGRAFSVINDSTYGSDCLNGEIRISMIRGAGFLAHPVMDRTILRQDRYSPHMDQGERVFRFRLEGGSRAVRMARVTREATGFNEAPYVLSFFPGGTEAAAPQPFVTLSDGASVLTATRPTENGLMIRLFNPTDAEIHTRVTIPSLGVDEVVPLGPGKIVTKCAADHRLHDAGLLS